MADADIPHVRGGDKKPRKNSPFTPEEWAALQVRLPGETDREFGLRLHRARYAKRVEKDPDHRKPQRAQWRAGNLDREREVARVWSAENPEKVKARQAAYYHRHKEERRENYRQWVDRNPERRKAQRRAWMEAHPGANAFYSAKWRRAARDQTPAWADLRAIKTIYEECARISAETGIPHHVDHEYPLRGRRVSGLHVANNLRIIPAGENVKKHNRHPEDI